MNPVGLNPQSRFALVHELARKERLRRHEVGCLMCKTFPDRCLFRQEILKVSRTSERHN